MNELSKQLHQESRVGISNAKAEVWKLIQALVLGNTSPDRILELFYWSQDPCSLELARASFVMTPESRAKLRAFLSVTKPQSISVKIVQSGQLILSSSDIIDNTAIMQELEREQPNGVT